MCASNQVLVPGSIGRITLHVSAYFLSSNQDKITAAFSQLSYDTIAAHFPTRISDDLGSRYIGCSIANDNHSLSTATLPTNAVARVLTDLLLPGPGNQLVETGWTGLPLVLSHSIKEKGSDADLFVASMAQPYVQMNCTRLPLSVITRRAEGNTSFDVDPKAEYVPFCKIDSSMDRLVKVA